MHMQLQPPGLGQLRPPPNLPNVAKSHASVRSRTRRLQVCPVDSEWVREQLVEGNVWLLTEPERHQQRQDRTQAQAQGSAGQASGQVASSGAVVGVMVMCYYDIYRRTCAGGRGEAQLWKCSSTNNVTYLHTRSVQ